MANGKHPQYLRLRCRTSISRRNPVLVMENVVYLGCVGSVLGRKFATLPIVKSEKYQSDHNQLTGGRCEKCNKRWGGP